MNQDSIIESLYPLPDDHERETLNIAWLKRIVKDIVRLNEAAGLKGHELQGPYPVRIGFEIGERVSCLSYATWFNPLQTYLNVELGMDTSVEAIDELIRRLSKRLCKPFHEIDLMPISEALRVIARTDVTPTTGRAPRGDLDERATTELIKNPSLSNTQIARIVKCSRTTLSNPKRCPMFVAARDRIDADKETWKRKNERGTEWNDRRRDDD
jgi:hypothetical protein